MCYVLSQILSHIVSWYQMQSNEQFKIINMHTHTQKKKNHLLFPKMYEPVNKNKNHIHGYCLIKRKKKGRKLINFFKM